MDIIYNARFLHYSNTGIGQYLFNLVKNISVIDKNNKLTLVYHKELEDPDKTIEKSFIHKIIKEKSFIPHKDLKKTYWEQIQFKNYLKKCPDSIVHVPYIAPPFNGTKNLVITVHDLASLHFPISKIGKNGVYDKYYTYFLKNAIIKAEIIIADSICTKKDLIKYINVPADKIEVIYLAADKEFYSCKNDPDTESVLMNYGLDKKYIFYLGDSSYRKNIMELLFAYHDLPEQFKNEYDLVLCGNSKNSAKITETALKLEKKRIKFLGFAEKKDLPFLYSNAYLFVFPTIFEGFGLPPLEAMSCGTPVISSNITSIPEVVGNGGILIDTTQRSELRNAMKKVIENKDLRAELVEKGLLQAKKFSWEKTAEHTHYIYKKIANK